MDKETYADIARSTAQRIIEQICTRATAAGRPLPGTWSSYTGATMAHVGVEISAYTRTASWKRSRALTMSELCSIQWRSIGILLTVVLQEPQRSGLVAKSAQTPEQQAGFTPGHGDAVQEPQ